jgi:nitrogen fixation NifU-like protein
MNDILDMYQDLIIDHFRSPKNYGELSDKSHHARGHNPLCGDIIDVNLLVLDDVITAISFNGDGCAISKASASLMTESVKGKSLPYVGELFNAFHQMLVGDKDYIGLGKLEVLKGVRQFPIRVKCATLCWHTLNAALKKDTHRVTTE